MEDINYVESLEMMGVNQSMEEHYEEEEYEDIPLFRY
jgi:hypothetical protein